MVASVLVLLPLPGEVFLPGFLLFDRGWREECGSRFDAFPFFVPAVLTLRTELVFDVATEGDPIEEKGNEDDKEEAMGNGGGGREEE